MWQGIYGHDAVVDQFRRSIASDRLASSYLFLGPAGVGKRAFALQLAKALLCPNANDAELAPCGNCDSCRLLEARTHPDVDVVGLPAGKRELSINIFLGDREHRHQEGLCHKIGLRPMMGRRRVAIIDDADGLNTESANCLLKTLEEPPPGVVLILIGTNRSRQLPTILSRTQVVRFEPLSVDVVSRLLLEQGIVTSEPEACELASAAGGSLQRATDLLAMNLGDFRERLKRQLIAPVLDGNRMVSIIADFVSEAGTEAEAKRQRMRAVFDAVTEYLTRVLRNNATAEDPAAPSAQSRVLGALDRCLLAEEELDRNANQATLLECWVDDLTRLLNPTTALR
jgi:DNA polymerase III subunit delta'